MKKILLITLMSFLLFVLYANFKNSKYSDLDRYCENLSRDICINNTPLLCSVGVIGCESLNGGIGLDFKYGCKSKFSEFNERNCDEG